MAKFVRLTAGEVPCQPIRFVSHEDAKVYISPSFHIAKVEAAKLIELCMENNERGSVNDVKT